MSDGSAAVVLVPAALVDELYGASLAPQRWPAVLAAVAGFVGGERCRAVAALSFMEGPAPGRGWLLAGVEGASERAYDFLEATAWHPLFVRAGALPEGYVGPSEEFASADELARTTLAREFLSEEGSIRGQSAVLHASDELLAAVHVLRPRQGAAWPEDAASRLRALLPHLRRSIEVYSRLRRSRAQSEIDRALLDRIDVAAFVIDGLGRLSRANAAGAAMLDRGDGLERVGDRLRCAAATADGALQRALTEAARRGAARGGSDVVVVPRRSGGRPLMAFVTGLPAGGAAVLARDPERHGPHVEELLQRLFELTPTEARVAVRVASGERPSEVGAVLGMAVATVRTHLKKVFDKTSTTGQAQVVRLVMGEVPPMGEGEAGGE
jgi:DNA-binding CsgD family transcriptional regulator